jgi:hypothetical protein
MKPDFIIRVELGPGDPRVCDYCNKLLVDHEAKVVEECHSTEYGLVCNRCLGTIPPISSHRQGDVVGEERWYIGR